MGSKNLKAMVVLGNGSVPIAEPDELKTYMANLTAHIRGVTEILRR
jgi:aldehyde:ferredoxin oxidoreductase